MKIVTNSLVAFISIYRLYRTRRNSTVATFRIENRLSLNFLKEFSGVCCVIFWLVCSKKMRSVGRYSKPVTERQYVFLRMRSFERGAARLVMAHTTLESMFVVRFKWGCAERQQTERALTSMVEEVWCVASVRFLLTTGVFCNIFQRE